MEKDWWFKKIHKEEMKTFLFSHKSQNLNDEDIEIFSNFMNQINVVEIEVNDNSIDGRQVEKNKHTSKYISISKFEDDWYSFVIYKNDFKCYIADTLEGCKRLINYLKSIKENYDIIKTHFDDQMIHKKDIEIIEDMFQEYQDKWGVSFYHKVEHDPIHGNMLIFQTKYDTSISGTDKFEFIKLSDIFSKDLYKYRNRLIHSGYILSPLETITIESTDVKYYKFTINKSKITENVDDGWVIKKLPQDVYKRWLHHPQERPFWYKTFNLISIHERNIINDIYNNFIKDIKFPINNETGIFKNTNKIETPYSSTYQIAKGKLKFEKFEDDWFIIEMRYIISPNDMHTWVCDGIDGLVEFNKWKTWINS